MKFYLTVAVFFLALANLGMLQHMNRIEKALTYHICNESRLSAEIKETECGNIQDELHTEFLCKANNNLESNFCWVEKK